MSSEQPEQHCSVFIGGFSREMSREQFTQVVESLCKSFGGIVDINAIPQRGIAFVEFSSPEDAQQCISELKGTTHEERPLEVQIARLQPHDRAAAAQSRETSVYIGGLERGGTKEEMTKLVERIVGEFGKIVDINPMPQHGYSFVTFTRDSDAADCIRNLNGTTIGENTLEVQRARHQRPKDSRDTRDNRDHRDHRGPRDHRERDHRDNRDSRDYRDGSHGGSQSHHRDRAASHTAPPPPPRRSPERSGYSSRAKYESTRPTNYDRRTEEYSPDRDRKRRRSEVEPVPVRVLRLFDLERILDLPQFRSVRSDLWRAASADSFKVNL